MFDAPDHPSTAQAALKTEHFLGFRVTPITRRRIENFKRNRRGYVSFWIFLVIFFVTLFAEVIANDKPLLVSFDGSLYVPAVIEYPETAFGGEFQTEADYRDEFVAELINEKGWMLWPPVRFSYDTVNYELPVPAPAPPSAVNWLGTDDQGRDVVARLIYGFRISVLFGFVLTIISAAVGVSVGAFQGFYGGLIDLIADNTISGKIAKDVLEIMFESGQDAAAIVEEKGLKQVSDSGAIEGEIDTIIAANPDKVAEFQSGKEKMIGWFVGQVMQATKGKANPQLVNQLLRDKLKP